MKKEYKIVIFGLFLMALSFNIFNVKAEDSRLYYSTHVQSYGWMDSIKEGETAGTTGESKRLESIKINLSKDIEGGVEYITYVQSYGWMEWVSNGKISGTEGEGKRLEAIKIRLTGKVAEKYDIYYRVHAQSYGWLNWAKNGETSGTIGLSKRLEAIEIKLFEKNTGAVTQDTYISKGPSVTYTTHVQSYGWLGSVKEGLSGTEGKSKRVEAYKVVLESPEYIGNLEYSSYIEGKGWENTWKRNNQVSGSVGEGKRIEQVKMRLVGDITNYYDVYYRTHVQGFGWLGWAKNGEAAGTDGIGFRIEGIEIKLVPKGKGEATGKSLEKKDAKVTYSSHIRKIGDQAAVAEGQTSGTTGQSLRMEGLTINLDTQLQGNILYKTYIDELGWESSYKKSGELSGTTGKSKAIQLLRIKLDGELAKKYDVYYRIHTETYGWMGWAKNDEITGADCYDIQAVQIRLYLKIDSSKNSLDRKLIYTQTGFYKVNGYTYYKDKHGKQATDWITIMGKKYFFNSLGIMIGKNVKKVMDVSAWQGDIDWDTVHKYGNLDGVILRISASAKYEDSKLSRNIEAVKRLGIPYGVYIYSYAENKNEAKDYADFTIKMLKKYNMNPKIGIFYDLESNSFTQNLSNKQYEEIWKSYLDTMWKAGYGTKTKIYTYKSLAEEKLYSSPLYNNITWIAQYYHFNLYSNNNVKGWQYSSEVYVPGVPTLADMSVWFKDF